MSAVRTRVPLPRLVGSNTDTERDGIDEIVPGGLTKSAIAVQPDWLREVGGRVGDRRLPAGARVLFTGCGTSFHAALACGAAVQALDHVVVVTPEIEESYCHTVSYTCAIAAGRALLGEDVGELAERVERELGADPLGASDHERFVVVGGASDQATVLEAVLKLREGAHVAAESHHTEQFLHGQLAAIDSSVRCFVLEGSGRAAERSAGLVRALGELGCDALLVPTTHPVVDIVRFQRLTCDLADARGIDPDLIRWDEEPWDRAR